MTSERILFQNNVNVNTKRLLDPRGYQINLENDIYAAWREGARNVMGVLPTGGGKCLGRGTPVLYYGGGVAPVEQVEAGDVLMGPDSQPRRVLSTTRGREMLYRVTPTKGDSYVVNESHILSLKRTNCGGPYESQRGGVVVNVAVRDYLQRSATFKHTHKGWRVGVDFPTRQALPIDPYFLGLWLGDGNSHNATITTGDAEVKSFLKEHAEALGMRQSVRGNSPGSESVATLGLSRTGRRGTDLMNALRALGVIHNKHIPHSYLTSAQNERLALLAGLLDSDGSYTGKGYDLVLKDERLFDQVLFLARSLGFAAYKSRVRKTCTNNGKAGAYWRTTISGEVDRVPCRISRKKAAPRRQKKNALVHGIRVEAIGEGDYFGFELDGDGLFLLGDFTVTHNTFVFSRVVKAIDAVAFAVAHRGELISQMSLALARNGVRHRVIGPAALQRRCSQIHVDTVGANYVNPQARVVAAAVDTLIRMENEPLFAQARLWVMDEAHHVLADNKWGKACNLFPNAFGLGVTATPTRADGKGLGRHADGLMDVLVQGPTMRELINQKFLTEYRIFAPPSDLDLSQVSVSENGDFSPPKLSAARRKSHITGDVVQHYLRIAKGKRGVTFDVDIQSATETAAAFNAAGVPAAVVSGKTEDSLRANILARFARGELLQLVNVDLFGEGFDLPAIEVVSFARPTMSFALFCQQFGRALRLMDGKLFAIIIDHVGNCLRHGLPDAPRAWSLDRRERRGKSAPSDVMPTRVCLNPSCMGVYERIYSACPYCGHRPEPTQRGAPEYVDGDLFELDPATLARLRGEQARIDGMPLFPAGAGPEVVGAIKRTHWERQQSQKRLRDAIALWAGWRNHLGEGQSVSYRRFFHRYGTDVQTAMLLSSNDAIALAEKVEAELNNHNVRNALQ